MIAALALTAVMTLSKTVILLPILPAAVIFCLTATDRSIRHRRLLILLVFILVITYWLVPRSDMIAPELSADTYNIRQETTPGDFYYLLLFLFGYRGFPLLAGLAILLVNRWRKEKFTGEDLVLLVFFLTPFIFYSFIATKRPWYPFVSYLAFPFWFVLSAVRTWEHKTTRIVSTSVLAFYLVLAFVNSGLVATAKSHDNESLQAFVGVTTPQPPSKLEQAIMDRLLTVLAADPDARIAFDCSRTEIVSYRFQTLLMMYYPCQAMVPQIVPTDCFGWQFNNFVASVYSSRHVIAIGDNWPFVHPNLLESKQQSEDFRPWMESLAAAKDHFKQQASFPLPANQQMTIFTNHQASRNTTSVHLPPLCRPNAPRQKEVDSLLNSKVQGKKAFAQGQFIEAAFLFATVIDQMPEDYEARFWLAKTMTAIGPPQTGARLWSRFITHCPVFGMVVQALQEMSAQEADGKLPEGLFERSLEMLLSQNAVHQDRIHSLLSVRLSDRQRRQTWNEALDVLQQIRSLTPADQQSGLNLTEAILLKQIGQIAHAEDLLRKNLQITSPEHPVYADSALALVDLLLEHNQPNEALKWVKQAAQGQFEPNNLARAVVKTAAQLPPEESRDLIEWATSQVSGSALALLHVEIGKQQLAAGKIENARQILNQALAETDDEILKDWINQTLTSIEAGEYAR